MAHLIPRLLATLATTAVLTQAKCAPVLERDVVIIGGGAGGAHAALRLKDMGQSIALVEKDQILVSLFAHARAVSRRRLQHS